MKENLYELLICCLKKKDYEAMWEVMAKLKEVDIINYNFYLYLISNFLALPRDEKEYLQSISFRDAKIKVRDESVERDKINNNIRFLCFTQRFAFAISHINKYLKERDDQALFTASFLVGRVIDERFYVKKRLFGLIREEKYEEAKEMLEHPLNGGKLSLLFGKFLKIIDSILIFQGGGICFIDSSQRVDGLFSAIEAKDFEKALFYSEEHNKKYEDLAEDSEIMYLLLKKVCDLKKSLEMVEEMPFEIPNDSLPCFSNVDITMGRTPVVVNDYGVSRLDDIFNLILGHTPLSEVQKRFKLSDEKMTIVELILAKELFSQGISESGNVFLSDVEDNGVLLSDVSKSLYEEVKKLSKEEILLNSDDESPYILSLKMVNPYLVVREP